MKLTDVKARETTVLKVRDPNTGDYLYDGKVPVTITLKGMHSDPFQNELLRQKHASSQKKNQVKSAQNEREDAAKLYASVFVSWTGIDGECNAENAKAVLEPDSMAWLRMQVSEELVELAESLKK